MIKRLSAISLIIAIVMNSVVGCSLLNDSDSDEYVNLSWYINFDWFNTEWGGNVVSDAITEEKHVTIDFVTPTGEPNDKLKSMIDSNSLPDIITLGWWESQIGEMIDNGMVYPLDELADLYEPYFWKVTDEDTVNWYKSDDGHLYQYPNSSFTPADYDKYENLASNETFLVRKDIYEAIGSPDMTTPEGFYSAVEKAAKMFPEVNGEELIPVGSHEFGDAGCDSFDGYLMDFLAVPYMKDGRAYDRITNDDYIKWLKMFRKLGSKGYLKDDIFIDTRTQMDEKIAQGRYFCMLYQRTDLQSAQKILYSNSPESIYIAVDGPKNSNGDDYTLPGTSINGWTVTLVSKNCKNPKKAIELISYLISEEGQLMTWMGVEGKTWEYDSNGTPRLYDDVMSLLAKNRIEFDKKYGADSCYWMFQNDAIASEWILEDPDSPMSQLKEWTYPYTVYNGQYTITFDHGTEEYEIKSKTDSEWGKLLPRLLLAKSDEEFDELYNAFIKERYEIGYDVVLDALTLEMNKNIKKLGLDNE